MAPIFKIAALLSLSLHVAAQGQFITGACASDAECASACCGFKSGKCAAPAVAQEKDGCGFGNAQANNDAFATSKGGAGNANAAAASSPSIAAAAAAPAASVASAATAPGKQFITGACTSDADCGSACCGFTSGKCAGPVVAQERDGGCGFGNPQPNDAAAQAVTGGASTANVAVAAAPATAAAAPAEAVPAAALATASTGAAGKQFITAACTSDADCGSACCGFKSGKCAGPAVAQERDGGCGFGAAQPNDAALKALQKRRF